MIRSNLRARPTTALRVASSSWLRWVIVCGRSCEVSPSVLNKLVKKEKKEEEKEDNTGNGLRIRFELVYQHKPKQLSVQKWVQSCLRTFAYL